MIRILILEDNLKALKVIMELTNELKKELGEIEITVISKGEDALKFANSGEIEKFDVILLDCISADGINFHQAVLGKVNPQKVVAISNTIAYNRLAKEAGVLRSIQKDYSDLEGFKNELKNEIKSILNFK